MFSSATTRALDARMKRTSAREMFRLAGSYLSQTQSAKTRGKGALFVILPHFNTCLRLHPEAIHLYFAHIHPRRNWRTQGLHAALRLAALLPSALRQFVLRALGDLTLHDPSPAMPIADWSGVDVLLAEWQFVGVFSRESGTVSHILTDEKYIRCLDNELDARAAFEGLVPFPRLLHARRDGDVRGWTESFIPNEALPSERGAAFSEIQRMLCAAYATMKGQVSTVDYLTQAEDRIQKLYPSSSPVGDFVQQLITHARWLAARQNVDVLPTARAHGDLTPGQVLVTQEGIQLIDWSESEVGILFHDYVYAALWRYGWRNLSAPIDVPDLRAMREGLGAELDRVSPLLAVILILIEVALKQHTDYSENRGTLSTWREIADSALALCTTLQHGQSHLTPSG